MNSEKVLLLFFALFVTCIFAFSQNAFAACDSTSYKTCSSAYKMPTGSTIMTGMCGSPQYYKITTSQTCTITWAMTPDSTANYALYVKNSSGSCPTTSSYSCRPYKGTGSAETCSARLSAGTYYAMVRKTSGTGSYSIQISNIDCETCTTHYFSTCYNNDVYWQDFCGNREDKKTECGSDSCGSWGSNYCSSGNVYRSRTCRDKGCLGNSCYSDSTTEEQLVQNCNGSGCTNGTCNSAPPSGCIDTSQTVSNPDGCTFIGKKRCQSSTTYNLCQSTGWIGSSYSCPSGTQCLNGTLSNGDWYHYCTGETVCGTSCTSECTSGTKRCNGSYSQTCGNYDPDSCYEWPASTSGTGNAYCTNGCSGSGVCNSCTPSRPANTCGTDNCGNPYNNCSTGYTCQGSTCVQNPTCTPNWSCGDWGSCQSSNTQTRVCTDLQNCGTLSGRPSITQSCTYTALPTYITHFYYKCNNNDLYWYDSRGIREDKKTDCAQECTNNACTSYPVGKKQCYDSQKYNSWTGSAWNYGSQVACPNNGNCLNTTDTFGNWVHYCSGETLPWQCHSGSNGSLNYCTSSCKCNFGQGSCIFDTDCASGLTCVYGVGGAFGLNPGVNVCMQKMSESQFNTNFAIGATMIKELTARYKLVTYYDNHPLTSAAASNMCNDPLLNNPIPHINIVVQDKSQSNKEVWNLHIGKLSKNGQECSVVFLKVNDQPQSCQEFCGSQYKPPRDIIKNWPYPGDYPITPFIDDILKHHKIYNTPEWPPFFPVAVQIATTVGVVVIVTAIVIALLPLGI